MDHLPNHLLQLIGLAVSTAGDSLKDLLNGLVTPLLGYLRIQHHLDSVPRAQLPFIFLRRSACAIRKLARFSIPLTDIGFIECVFMLPSLVELIVWYDVGDATPLQQFIHQPLELRDSSPLGPRIQVIMFQCNSRVNGWILGDMVASR